jgi:hypothetical protein
MILIRLLVNVWSDMILLCLKLERNKRGDLFVGVLFEVGLASLVLGVIGVGSLGFLSRAFACGFALALAFAFAVLISLWTLSRSFSLAFVASCFQKNS